AGDRDDLAAEPDVVDVGEQDHLRRHLALPHVGQERHLAGALDGGRDLHLVAPAGAGDAARADLALLGDEAAQLIQVLVVDVLDLHPAEVAVALPGLALLEAGPAAGRASFGLLGHAPPQNGMSSSVPETPKSASAVAAAPAPSGTNCGRPSPSERLSRN